MNTPLQNTPSPMQEKTTVMSPVSLSHGADGRSFEGGHGPAHAGGGHWRDKPASTPNGSRGRRVLIALGVVLAVLVIAYGGGVVLFGNVCYPNTVIADTDVSLMTRDTAISRVRSSAEGYRLTVEGDGFTWTFDPESASEVIDAEARSIALSVRTIRLSGRSAWLRRFPILISMMPSNRVPMVARRSRSTRSTCRKDSTATPSSPTWMLLSMRSTRRAPVRSTPRERMTPMRASSRWKRRVPIKGSTRRPLRSPRCGRFRP